MIAMWCLASYAYVCMDKQSLDPGDSDGGRSSERESHQPHVIGPRCTWGLKKERPVEAAIDHSLHSTVNNTDSY
jgi:hypothetical protein